MTTCTFDGETIDRKRDTSRLKSQLSDLKRFVADGNWHTLDEIANRLGYPEASISARLRDLRKAKFGSHIIEREYVERGLFRYRLVTKEYLF